MDEISEADPAGTLALLKEAAEVYDAVGRIGRAAELKAKAKAFAARHPKAEFPSGYGWTPYKVASAK